MACEKCDSGNHSTFNGEVAIHFPGLKGLDKPIVWVFPKLLVCLNCGLTEFTVPETEYAGTKGRNAPSAAADLAAGGRGLSSVEVLNRQSKAEKLSALKNRVHSS